MGKVEKTRFERNWTTFVKQAFCPAWKSPLKMVVWNRPRGIRSQGCYFVLPRWGKSKKRVLNAIGRSSSNRLFALLGKAHSKWWYETDLVEFDPKGVISFRPDGESRKNAFWTQLDDVRQPGFLPCLEKPTQNGGMKPTSWNSIPRVLFRFAPMGKVEKTRFERIGRSSSNRLFALLGKAHSKWWYETDLVVFEPKGVFSFRPDGESRKNAFWTDLDDVRQPGFLHCLEKPTQNGGMKPTSWSSIPRVFFRFALMGKVKKNAFWTQLDDVPQPGVLNAIGRRSSTRLLALLLKAPSKWWYETDLVEFDPKGVFSFRRDKECRKNAFWTQLDDVPQPGVLNAIGRRSSTRLFALLLKAPSKWWYETDLVEFDPKGVFSFRRDKECRKNAFWTQLDDVRQPGFLPCLKKPTQNGGMKPTSWNSILRVFFRFAPMGKVEKTRFERNWTKFVNLAFCPAWKSPRKMVVWNQPSGIRSQGCFFV